MRIKRKITKINDSAADSAAAEDNHGAAKVAAVSAAAVPSTGRGRSKPTDIAYALSPGSTSSSEHEHTAPSLPVFEPMPIPTNQSFTGLGKKHKKTKKMKLSDEDEELLTQPKKRWTKRPEHWRQIAEYYKNNSLEATLIEFHDDLGDFSTIAQYHKLHSWKKELENDIDIRIQPPGREPAYGNEIDLKLLDVVMDLLNAGNPVDDATLRGVLVDILTNEGRADLLVENGGSCVFQTSWAARFWKRHEAAVKDLRLKNIGSVSGTSVSEPRSTKKKQEREAAAEGTGANASSASAGSSSRSALEDDKKPWTRRPSNWIQMAEYFAEHGISNALSTFRDDLGHLSYSAAYQKLNNWRNDMISQRELHSPGRPPNYGELIDNQLLAIVQDRIKTGQSVDDYIMREILVDLLTAVGKEGLLREHGGECTFGHSWAVRFRKRHNLPTKDQNGRKRKRPVSAGEREESGAAMNGDVNAFVAASAGGVEYNDSENDSEDDDARVEFTKGSRA